jgi:two-component system, LuxR family, sensor kinase FixL
VQLTADLENRVIARTSELEQKSEELRGTTQQLWQAAKLATMGEIAASVAHELNNPLATVSLRVESMLDDLAADAPHRRSLEIVDAEVDRMARLVARLLEFSRRVEPQSVRLDLPAEVSYALELMQNYLIMRGVAALTDFGPGPFTVLADRQQIRQVLLNLFTNAVDAMPDGGTLTIRIRQIESASTNESQDQRQAGTATTAKRQAVAVDVCDTGIGIARELLPQIFEAFFTTKSEGKGTGLGLAICRRAVQEHNGTLAIDSEPGRGTTVRLTLPAV